MSRNIELTDRKERFSITVFYALDTIHLKNIVVSEKYRDRGLARRVIYTLWRASQLLKTHYIVANIVSPIIEMIVKKYYIWEIVADSLELSMRILGINDPDYSESILPLFLDIYKIVCSK